MGKKLISTQAEKDLNDQMTREGHQAQIYLALGSWAESQGFGGVSAFLYHHAEEERAHMMKLLRFINQRGGHCKIQPLPGPLPDPRSLESLFEAVLNQEIKNSAEIFKITDRCLKAKDFITFNFMMWFVKEQEEEEAMATELLDKMKVAGQNKGTQGGLFELDKELSKMQQEFPIARQANAAGDES